MRHLDLSACTNSAAAHLSQLVAFFFCGSVCLARRQVYRIDLDTVEGFGASFATYGATLLSVRSGDQAGNIEEVCNGCQGMTTTTTNRCWDVSAIPNSLHSRPSRLLTRSQKSVDVVFFRTAAGTLCIPTAFRSGDATARQLGGCEKRQRLLRFHRRACL